ncbi:MAG: DUF4411 family protein [Gammaproteobacteria bacterium]|nr:DUF4411 family protein [Gammaproteobacteria bacterium]
MPRYCLDTSGITNPLLDMPPDVHVSLWREIMRLIEDGVFCWNMDIWNELSPSVSGEIGECLSFSNEIVCFEVGIGDWPWQKYLEYVELMRTKYKDYISEYNGNRKGTISLNDCSIVCLAKTLGLSVMSMEKPYRQPSQKKIRIPELCSREGIRHYDLTELLRAEGITA